MMPLTPRRCHACAHAIMRDTGYSNWTVEGTDFECSLNLHPSPRPVDIYYGDAKELKFAQGCPFVESWRAARVALCGLPRGMLRSKPWRGDDAVSQRFWDKVKKTPACWVWAGVTFRNGYGQFGRHSLAHRIAWELMYGPIPAGLCVLHRCDNPPCVRPDHLFLGTVADNNHDMCAKGRNGRNGNENKTHCLRGHPLAGSNLYVTPGGTRACKACGRTRGAAYRLRIHRRHEETVVIHGPAAWMVRGGYLTPEDLLA